jgi:hypothetical protein
MIKANTLSEFTVIIWDNFLKMSFFDTCEILGSFYIILSMKE